MLKKQKFTSNAFSILRKNGQIEHYDSAREGSEPIHRFKEIASFLKSENSSIDCLLIKQPGLAGPNFFFPQNLDVENVILYTCNESGYYYLDEEYFESSNKNYFIYSNYVSRDFVLHDLDLYKNSKIKFLLSTVGHYGSDHTGQTKVLELNTQIEIDKLKNLKKYNKLLWAGKIHGNRKKHIEEIQKLGIEVVILDSKPPVFVPYKQKYIDALNEYECCAVLSLDGASVSCHRDTECAYSFVPNLKYTVADLDIDAGSGIYLAKKDISSVVEQMNKIKVDLYEDNYTKIIKARNWMVKINSMFKRRILDYGLFAFALYKGINLDNIILYKDYNEETSSDLCEAIFKNINNFI